MAMEATSHQPSGRLRHWLQNLQTAKNTVSQASKARGLWGVRDLMATWVLLHPISGDNLPLLLTTGDHGLPGGLCHPQHLPSAGGPAVHSPPGAMHLAPSALQPAWCSIAPKDAPRTWKNYLRCIIGLYFLFKHFS